MNDAVSLQLSELPSKHAFGYLRYQFSQFAEPESSVLIEHIENRGLPFSGKDIDNRVDWAWPPTSFLFLAIGPFGYKNMPSCQN